MLSGNLSLIFRKGYKMPELHFKGKEFVYNHHLTVPYRPLIAQPEKLGDNPEISLFTVTIWMP